MSTGKSGGLKYEQAEPFYKRAIAVREKALGEDHPSITRILVKYAEMLHHYNGMIGFSTDSGVGMGSIQMRRASHS